MAFWQTWAKVMFDPMKFYEEVPNKIRYKEPSLFYIKLLLLTSVILLVLIMLFASVFLAFVPIPELAGLGLGVLVLIAIIGIPLYILFSWGMLFVGAGLVHLFVLMFGGKQGYQETFKAVAYASAPTLFAFIPLINYIVAIYSIVLQVIGIHKRQKLDVGRSIGAVSLPVVLLFVIIFIIVFSIAMMGALVPSTYY